jgi:hypothetical protein
MNLYYAQASAATHYLLDAEGGRHRAAFLDLVVDHYKGKVEAGAVAKRFGAAPEELGARIVSWCRERAGRRP